MSNESGIRRVLKLINHPSLRRFPRFFASGAMGFCIDAGLLLILDGMGYGPYWSRAVSFPTALFATWIANRYWTFAEARSSKRAIEFTKYAGVVSLGATINLGVYSFLLITIEELRGFLVIPLAIGAIAGLVINYSGSHFLVFKESTTEPEPIIKGDGASSTKNRLPTTLTDDAL